MRILVLACLTALLGAAESWSGLIRVETTFAGPRGGGERASELDAYTKALEGRLATLQERRRTADGVAERVLARDIGQIEGELEAIAIERGAWVGLGSETFQIDGQHLAQDADQGRLIVDRQAQTGHVVRAGTTTAVKLAALPPTAEPEGTTDGPVWRGHATRQATVAVVDNPVRVVWVPGLPNTYALCRLDSQTSSKLHGFLATLPGLPIDVESDYKGGRLRWRVVDLAPGAVDPVHFRR